MICTKSFSEVGAFVNQETKKPETKGNEMDYKEMWLGKSPLHNFIANQLTNVYIECMELCIPQQCYTAVVKTATV